MKLNLIAEISLSLLIGFVGVNYAAAEGGKPVVQEKAENECHGVHKDGKKCDHHIKSMCQAGMSKKDCHKMMEKENPEKHSEEHK